MDDKKHNADSHIHVKCNDSEEIIEIDDETLFEYIKKSERFKNFNIKKIQLVVTGECLEKKKDFCMNELCSKKKKNNL